MEKVLLYLIGSTVVFGLLARFFFNVAFNRIERRTTDAEAQLHFAQSLLTSDQRQSDKHMRQALGLTAQAAGALFTVFLAAFVLSLIATVILLIVHFA